MKYFKFSACVITLLCSISYSSIAIEAPNRTQTVKISDFDIKSSAGEKDWTYFFAAKASWRLSLWKYQENLGNSLDNWHWTWRIGWVKVCDKKTDIKLEHCKKAMTQARTDNALVVRAELVNLLGTKFIGTENTEVIRTLKKMYSDKRNSRAGKPLYIQKQIIYAIKSVGGDFANETASILAKSHPEIASYYMKLKPAEAK
jgi:hypothetical protein